MPPKKEKTAKAETEKTAKKETPKKKPTPKKPTPSKESPKGARWLHGPGLRLEKLLPACIVDLDLDRRKQFSPLGMDLV
jgi:hypothetical protein